MVQYKKMEERVLSYVGSRLVVDCESGVVSLRGRSGHYRSLKFGPETVVAMRARRAQGAHIRTIAAEFGASVGRTSELLRAKRANEGVL